MREGEREYFQVTLGVELNRTDDGNWSACVAENPDVRIYGGTRSEALGKAKALALRLLAEQAEIEPLSAEDRLPIKDR